MRIVSFTFDDGLIRTARRIADLKIPATFYLVTGWVDKTVRVEDEFNAGADHGSWDEWRELQGLGLDLGCHSHSHSRSVDPLLDSMRSRDVFEQNLGKARHFAFPYGEIVPCCLFETYKTGFSRPFNDLRQSKRYLTSYNPSFDPAIQVSAIPSDHWLIFTFHGIDEGWRPVREEEIVKLYEDCLENNVEVKTMSEAMRCIRTYWP